MGSSAPLSDLALIAMVVGALVTLFKPLLSSIFVTLVLGLVVGVTDGAAALGSPFQDLVLGYFAGNLTGLALRLGFAVLMLVSRVFSFIAPEIPWIVVCACLLFLAIRFERRAPPGQGSPTLGSVIVSGYRLAVSYL